DRTTPSQQVDDGGQLGQWLASPFVPLADNFRQMSGGFHAAHYRGTVWAANPDKARVFQWARFTSEQEHPRAPGLFCTD
ncbi:MAG TPA: hypothetical protein PK238_02105, partial [Giesbergeria sp.]|nr:hypothetical protein [Giesbergeria sp.]